MRTGWMVLAALVGCAADTSDVPTGTAEIAGDCAAVGGVWAVDAGEIYGKRQSCGDIFRPASLDFAASQTWMGMPCTLTGSAEQSEPRICNYTYTMECPANDAVGVVYRWQIELERNEARPGWMVGTIHAETLRSGRTSCESTWGADLTR